MKSKKRKSYDWEAIEKQYRGGIHSIREIARLHGCGESTIRKKANKKSWKRDLTQKVRTRVRGKMSQVRTPEQEAKTEEESIEEVANQVVEILTRQHKDLNTLAGLIDTIADELRSGEYGYLVFGDDPEQPIERIQKMRPPEKATLLNSIAGAIERKHNLERKSYNIDESGGKQDSPNIFMYGAEDDDGQEKRAGRYTSFPKDDLTIEEWQEQVENLNNGENKKTT